ncbi:MAG: hypothetical protein FWG75_05755 [Cystobacterineae bacterium]|nr:hypothetical protein [Cystobacterineae bacterium]
MREGKFNEGNFLNMEAQKEALLVFFPLATSKQPTGEREHKTLAERSWAMHSNVNKT